MLERFKVPEDIAVRIDQKDMRKTVEEIFMKMQMNQEDSKQAADVLIYADLRGVESHGVSNMMKVYIKMLKEGTINPNPKTKIIREALAVATIDSDRGHGLVVGPKGMKMAIERAEKYEIGAITVTNGTHFGVAAYHASMAIEHDMIGMAMTTGGLNVLPTNGAEPKVGLNPVAFAVPAKEEPHFIFDATMSSVALNKIRLADRLGVNVYPGWISDEKGTPIMEEKSVPKIWNMLPLGGTREIGSHKGYSLAVIIEILCSLLGGDGAGPFRKRFPSHHFLAYKISAFGDEDSFKKEVDRYLKSLKDTIPAPYHDRVFYAGLIEYEEEIQRLKRGIPYHPKVIQWFRETTIELGLPNRFN